MIKPDHPIFMKKDIPQAQPPKEIDSDGKDDFTEGKTYHDTLKKVTIQQYEIASDYDNNFLKRVGHFLLGTSNAGRWGKVIKDFALFFVPYGHTIRKGTDAFTDFIESQLEPNQNDMAQTKPKPKLLITNIIIGLASALILVGVLPAEALDLSSDAAWVGIVYSFVNGAWNYFDNKETK